MLSPTYEITTALSHTDELISPPYDIAIVTISYGRVTMSSVWDSMMSKKNMGWPFYAAVQQWVTFSCVFCWIARNPGPCFNMRTACLGKWNHMAKIRRSYLYNMIPYAVKTARLYWNSLLNSIDKAENISICHRLFCFSYFGWGKYNTFLLVRNSYVYEYVSTNYHTLPGKIWNIWKTQWKYSYLTIWFAGNGLVAATNKY